MLLTVVPAHTGDNSNSKARSCSEVRQFYTGKGFTLNGVPQTEISGDHLRVCPQVYTCCTSSMEESLSALSRGELEGLVREAGRSLQASLNAQYRSFDTYFTELLSRSERSLQTSLGSLYSQNAALFSDLYADLRLYHRGSALNLDETLSEFWPRLLERVFRSSAQHLSLSEDYMECVAKQRETLRPFGDAPRDFKVKVMRAFVTSRSFVQGLIVSGDVVRKVSQVPLGSECTQALMKMVYCPQCSGLNSVRPCSRYCSNVMKGCLANQADLDAEWQSLIDTMLQVASSFSADPSLDVVLSSIPLRLSEAVRYLQENLGAFTAQVFQTCGSPGPTGTEGPSPVELRTQVSPTTGLRLEMQVSDLSSKLREMQQYWIQLPTALCSKLSAGAVAQEDCWNGMTKGSYPSEVMADGLANQINNPEVELDITKPDMTIRQQIMQLKISSNRLKNALDGNDVDFQDTSDDVSGSGSGMCVGGSCSRVSPRGRPGLYAYPPDNDPIRGLAPPPNRPSSLLLLLSLAALLLWR
ncbi:glypican-1 [Aplochiton taeniatus]